jgi:hypothetical protein
MLTKCELRMPLGNVFFFSCPQSIKCFHTEYGGDMFLRNVGWLSRDCTALYLKRENSSVVTSSAVGWFVIDICFPYCYFQFLVDLIHSFTNGSKDFFGPWPLLQFRNLFYTEDGTPWTSDQPVSRPLPIHKTTQTHTQTSMPWVGFEDRPRWFQQAFFVLIGSKNIPTKYDLETHSLTAPYPFSSLFLPYLLLLSCSSVLLLLALGGCGWLYFSATYCGRQ